MESVDCLIVGAGVIGLAVARALALAGREVVVVESESAMRGTNTRP
jgi:2-polyprenyl-6-methoxyphenol hydroxylase-like FAD-dependent oxidoreductase